MQWSFRPSPLSQMLQLARVPYPWAHEYLDTYLGELLTRALRCSPYAWRARDQKRFTHQCLELISALVQGQYEHTCKTLLTQVQRMCFKNAHGRYLISYALDKALRSGSPLYRMIDHMGVCAHHKTLFNVQLHFGTYFDFYDTGRTPLEVAAEHGYTSACAYYLAQGYAPIRPLGNSNPEYSALHLSATTDHLPTFKLLWNHTLTLPHFDPQTFLYHTQLPVTTHGHSALKSTRPVAHLRPKRHKITLEDDFWSHLIKHAARGCFEYLSAYYTDASSIICARIRSMVVSRLSVFLKGHINAHLPTVENPNPPQACSQSAFWFLQQWVHTPQAQHPYDISSQNYQPPHPFLALLLVPNETLYQHYFFHNQHLPTLLNNSSFLRLLLFYSAWGTARGDNHSLSFFAQHLSAEHWNTLVQIHQETPFYLDPERKDVSPLPLLLFGFGIHRKTEQINALLEQLLRSKTTQCALESQLTPVHTSIHPPTDTSELSLPTPRRTSVRL